MDKTKPMLKTGGLSWSLDPLSAGERIFPFDEEVLFNERSGILETWSAERCAGFFDVIDPLKARRFRGVEVWGGSQGLRRWCFLVWGETANWGSLGVSTFGAFWRMLMCLQICWVRRFGEKLTRPFLKGFALLRF